MDNQMRIRVLPDDWNILPEYPDSRLACEIALATALRLAEVVSLNASDFASNRVKVKVKGKDKRTGLKRVEEVYFAPGMMEKITAHQNGRTTGPLLLAPHDGGQGIFRITPRMIERHWHDCQVKATIERPYRFHDLRHTAITWFYRKCNNLVLTAMYARHRNIQTTVIYTHPTTEDKERIMQQMEEKK